MNNEVNILYRDEWFVAIDKPNGMMVHKGPRTQEGDLVALQTVRDQLGCFIFTVHRLDRPTSGVLLFALAKEASGAMTKLFDARQVSKHYFAVVRGRLEGRGTINTPLSKTADPESKLLDCLTQWEATANCFRDDIASELTLLSISPASGRFHQIRRHLAGIGHPIVGDYLYGEIEWNEKLAETSGISRMMLMSDQLGFTHPFSGEELRICTDVPDEFLKLTEQP